METQVKYTLYCGKLKYDVTNKVFEVLRGVMHWADVEETTLKELNNAIRTGKDQATIAELEYEVSESRKSLRDYMDKMNELNVPNWVGNGCIEFGKTKREKELYFSDFFTKGKYSKKENIER